MWLLLALIQGFTGTACGLLFSITFEKETTAINLVYLFQSCLYFCCGMFANLKNRNNILLDFLNFISPFTYTTEAMMYLFLNKVEQKQELLDHFGFDKGIERCALGTLSVFASYFLLAWIITIIKSKYR